MQPPHIPVLPNEVKSLFSNLDTGYFLDCTLGYSGHSHEILASHKNINLIGCDKDEVAINFSRKKLSEFKNRVTFEHSSFSKVVEKYDDLPIVGLLADVGVSSLQLDDTSRGFGFDSDTLDMRMDIRDTLSAYEVVNRYSKDELERIFKNYGEIKEYKKIAKKICDFRENESIKDAKTLSDLIGRKSSFSSRKVSPATLAFQAIRIEVNSELKELEELLESIEKSKINNCIVVIISFHSLEDRIVKQTFKSWAKSCICPKEAFKCTCGNNHSLGEMITKKVVEATHEEIKINPRSRSAKLRAFHIRKNEKI